MNTQPFKLVPIKNNYVHTSQVHLDQKHFAIIHDGKVTLGDFYFKVKSNGDSKPPKTGTTMFVWIEGEELLALPKSVFDQIIKNNASEQVMFDHILELKLSQTIKLIDSKAKPNNKKMRLVS